MEPAPVTNITNNAPAAPLKSGWRTSEFWLSLLALIVGAVASSGLLPGGAPTQIAGIVSSVLGALGYSTNRSLVKRGGAAPLAALLVLLLAAPARAGGPEVTPRAPLPADLAAVAPAPVPLTASQQAACVAERAALSTVDAVAACTSSSPPPPMDTRTFLSVLISGSVTALQSLVGTLVLALNPTPLGK